MTEWSVRQALAASLENVLEKMFFAPSAAEERASPAGPTYSVRLSFDGDLRGRLTLRIGAAAAHSIAADFLGEEETALTARQVKEVVCELANIVCGSMLSRIEKSGEFRLGAPEPAAWSEAGRFPGGVTYAAGVGGGALEAVVEMEGAGCPQMERPAS